MHANDLKRLLKKANKLQQHQLYQIIAPILRTIQENTSKLCTNDGEPLQMQIQWGTQLNKSDSDWIFDLFKRNMRNLYIRSQWGYDEHSKRQELEATTARFLILQNLMSKPIGYTHFRFVDDDARPVLYCYEIQVEKDYQNKGVGSILINMLECIAKSAKMEALMATVFAFNSSSLAFFHKHGFRSDRTCLFGKDGPEGDGRDYIILSKNVNYE